MNGHMKVKSQKKLFITLWYSSFGPDFVCLFVLVFCIELFIGIISFTNFNAQFFIH